jgi:hypothetical protein
LSRTEAAEATGQDHKEESRSSPLLRSSVVILSRCLRPLLSKRSFGLIHPEIREPVSFLVQLAANVFEGDAADPACQRLRLLVKGPQSGMLHPVLAPHLPDEEFGIGAHVKRVVAAIEHPGERGKQSVVFGDVVRRHPQRTMKVLEHRSVGGFDAHAVSRGPRIAAGASIDVRGQHGQVSSTG